MPSSYQSQSQCSDELVAVWIEVGSNEQQSLDVDSFSVQIEFMTIAVYVDRRTTIVTVKGMTRMRLAVTWLV